MPSTYSPSLRLELIGAGEQAANWGNTTNYNLGTLLEQAIAGVQSVAVSGASYTLTTGSGVADEARNAVLVLTGTLAASCNVIVPTADKTYTFRNATTGGFSVVVKTAAGSGVTIANGFTQQVYCDATNVVAAGVPFNTATNTITTNVSGNVAAGAGSAVAPSVSFSGDADTGVFNPAPNEIGLSTAGAEKIRLDSSGNVGIGTTGPSSKLEVVGSITTRGAVPEVKYLETDTGTVIRTLVDGSLWSVRRDDYSVLLSINNSNGQISAGQAGTAAAPAYSFATDLDTGFFNSGPNVLSAALNGQTALTLSDGSAQVLSNAAADVALLLRNNTASGAVDRASVIGTLNELGVAVASITSFIQSNGASQVYIEATPAGSRSSDRRVQRISILGGGAINMAGPVSVTSGGQTVTGDLEASGNLRFNSGYGSAGLAFGVRGWASVTVAAGAPTMDANGNFTSITDNGVGDFTFNFTSNMPDTHYAVAGSAVGQTNTAGVQPGLAVNTANGQPLLKSTSQVRVGLYRLDANSYVDAATFSIMIVR